MPTMETGVMQIRTRAAKRAALSRRGSAAAGGSCRAMTKVAEACLAVGLEETLEVVRLLGARLVAVAWRCGRGGIDLAPCAPRTVSYNFQGGPVGDLS